MRMCFSRARAASKAGMMTARKWSNGILSRKKNDSLVVIASITSTVSGAAAVVALSLSTSSARPANPCLRATGNRRLSARFCFRPRAPDRSARATSCADSRSPAGSRLVPREQAREAGRDLVERQHGRAEAGMCDLAGHAPHHAGRLVLRQDAAAGGGSILAQDEPTSVVWGMPGQVAHAGLCSAVLPLDEIASRLTRLFAGDKA